MTFGELVSEVYRKAREEYGLMPEEFDKLRIQFVDLSGFGLDAKPPPLHLTLIGETRRSFILTI